MLYVIGFTLVGFAGMEIASYCLHRFLFHGILWGIHESHHKPNHGIFELNDVFSLGFAGIAVWLMISGSNTITSTPGFGLGLGITIYGILYFIIHDLFTHKRFIPFRNDNTFMKLVRRAHQRHHQDVGKKGHEPYGLFLFPYDKYPEKKRNRKPGD